LKVPLGVGFSSLPTVALKKPTNAPDGSNALTVWRTFRPATRVRGPVRKMKGTFSSGTAASLIATVEGAAREPAIHKILSDPFALTPGFVGAAQPNMVAVARKHDSGTQADHTPSANDDAHAPLLRRIDAIGTSDNRWDAPGAV
jgi:hypothetical protein